MQHQVKVTRTRSTSQEDAVESAPGVAPVNEVATEAGELLRDIATVLDAEVDAAFRLEPGADDASWYEWYRQHQGALTAAGWLYGCSGWTNEHTGDTRPYRS